MPKNRMLPRTAYKRSAPLDSDGYISGTWIRPGSMPINRAIAKTLSQLSPATGLVTSGTAIYGDTDGAHTIIGGKARGGIQIFSGPNMLEFAVTPSARGVTFRLGALNQPGITMAGGTLIADGDIIALGSIRANRLYVGSLARTLLEDDRLFISSGAYDPDNYSGFLATSGTIGGYLNGVEVWGIDTTTGAIVTRDADQPSTVYAQLGSKRMHFANVDTWSGDPDHYHDLSMITFTTRYEVAGTTQQLGLASDALGVKIIDLDSATGEPYFSLENMGGLIGRLSRDYLYLTGRFTGRATAYVQFDDQDLTGNGEHLNLRIMGEDAKITNLHLDRYGLLLTANTERAPIPEEGRLHYDQTNHRWEFYNGTEWRYFEDASAA